MAEETQYPLLRGMQPSIRLNLQHYTWKEGLGYLIHPSIPLSEENYRIADLGTGTGIWLLDVARQVPSTTQLYGFDISDSQYPHVEGLPPNIQLGILDCYNPEIAPELQGSFDFVHLRLFLMTVPSGDPTGLLTNVLKLLKPGGYIQWDEYDLLRGSAGGPGGEPSPFSQKILTLVHQIKDHRWIEQLPEYFKKSNLQDVEVDFAHPQAWQRKIASELSCAVVYEMEQGGNPHILEKIKALGVSVPEAYAEVVKGSHITTPFCVTVGRKTEHSH